MALTVVDYDGVLPALADDPEFTWDDRLAIVQHFDRLCDESFDHGDRPPPSMSGLPTYTRSFPVPSGLAAITYQIAPRAAYGDNAALYVLDVGMVP